MIRRDLAAELEDAATRYPVCTVTGPRQSGKTTLCRATFPDHEYVTLEALDERERAREDPRGFLAQHRGGAILDEVQNVPELLSYLQGEVDEDPSPGRFILTGSQHFGLSEAIAQSLAGRTSVLHLLPPSYGELLRFDARPTELWDVLFHGAYPRIFDAGIAPPRWLADYVATYVERDARRVLNIGDLQALGTFVRLAAGRTAQELNLSELGADAGVSHNTARAWLSVLETSFLVHRLPAFHRNLRKRLVKSPKLHFFDSGLVCHLLGIEDAGQLTTHPLRGAIFETWVVSEIYKMRVHAGLRPQMSHVRMARGAELDCVVETGGRYLLVEAKSGATVHSSFLQGLVGFTAELEQAGVEVAQIARRLVYGGAQAQRRSQSEVIPWSGLHEHAWR
jgi:uncharacterized protein